MKSGLICFCLAVCGACGSGSTNNTPPDSGPTGCPTPTGGPTQHGGTVASDTWTANASPHLLPSGTTITGTLTLQPCAEVLIGGGQIVTVDLGGKLVAEGLADKPIHIGASDPTRPFARIHTTSGGTMRLVHVTIDGGGDRLNTIADFTGMLDLAGADGTVATQEILFVDHVTLSGSKTNGLVLRDGAGFATGSTDLTITGSVLFPVSAWGRAIGGLPPGKYTGNANDEILIPTRGLHEQIKEDQTMHDRGVPYRLGDSAGTGELYVGTASPAGGLATLTIEPGVKLRVKKRGAVYIESASGSTTPARGALIAAGTATKPIVFTSAEPSPAAGDWNGVWFGMLPDPADQMDYVRVEYAGGTSGTISGACNIPRVSDAAIRVLGVPGGAFVTNSTILSSAGHGIDRGWRGDSLADFLPTNTFVSVTKCKQTYPSDHNGACPSPVPCP